MVVIEAAYLNIARQTFPPQLNLAYKRLQQFVENAGVLQSELL